MVSLVDRVCINAYWNQQVTNVLFKAMKYSSGLKIYFFQIFANIVWVKMNNTGKWLFYDHFWPFFANCMVIFHKTEVQTVILMCLMGLNSNWFKGYDTKSKYFHFRFLAILYKNTHLHFLHFCILCHNFWTN